MSTEILSVRDLYFAQGERVILQKLSFTMERGEVVSLLGPSGSGKSTLFRLLLGLEQWQKGTITSPLLPLRESSCYLMQRTPLLSWRTIEENLTLFLSKESIEEKLPELLERFHCPPKMLVQYPHQLSVGMRQKICLIGALLEDKPLLLLDEPFSSLDLFLREEMYRWIEEHCQKEEKSVFLITHDFYEATSISDRILLLGEGRILQEWHNHSNPRALIGNISESLRKLYS